MLSNFLKLISPQLANRLRQQRGAIRLGGEFREATIMFSDVRGFTSLARRMEPDEVTEMLEDYFGRLVPVVSECHGSVDKFVGDAIVAVFEGRELIEQRPNSPRVIHDLLAVGHAGS
ncbi:MAG TPA: adenylate/guanylate cyclase domain-containing protein [Pyrinomonadaceae bacterium]